MRLWDRHCPITIALATLGLFWAGVGLALASEQSSSGLAERATPELSQAATPSGSLDALVAEAMRQSPLVIAARNRWEASTKVPIQAATLPDPQITLQEFTVGGPRPLEGYETSDFYYTGFGASQDIPWPSKLRLQSAAAKAEAEYARQAYEAARREAAEKVRESYFELFFDRKSLAILAQTREELEQIEKITEVRYRLGQGQEQDVSKAQLEMTAILEQIEMRRVDDGQRQAALKAILGRDPASPDIAIAEVAPNTSTLEAARLGELATERSPEIKMARAMETRSVEALKLANQGYMPDLSVGYMYQKTGPGFRDYYMLTLGAKIPLYFWRKQTPAIEQAGLEERAAHGDTVARELAVRSTATSDLLAAQTADRVMTLYRQGLIPQAEATRAAALNAYRLGKVDFQTLLSAVIDLLNQEQGYYRALADHETALAKLRQIVGEMP